MTSLPLILLAFIPWLCVLLGTGAVPRSKVIQTEEKTTNSKRPFVVVPKSQSEDLLLQPSPISPGDNKFIDLDPRPSVQTLPTQLLTAPDVISERQENTMRWEGTHGGQSVDQYLFSIRKQDGVNPCRSPNNDPALTFRQGWSSPSIRQHQRQIKSDLSLLQKRASSTAPPPPALPLRVLPANHPQLVQPLLKPLTTQHKSSTRPHHTTALNTRPKSKQKDPVVHAAAAGAIIPPRPHKGLHSPSKHSNSNSASNNNSSSNSNSNNDDSLAGQASGGGTDPQSEQEQLLLEEQKANKASPKVILIALGASIGGLGGCFCCLLGFGHVLGCCYWKRQLGREKRRSSLPLPCSGHGPVATLPRDRKWIIGGPKPLKDDEGEQGNQFSTGFHGAIGGKWRGRGEGEGEGSFQMEGPLSASLSTASTLVSQERHGKDVKEKQVSQLTEFWHDSSPEPSSFSLLKCWKKPHPLPSQPRVEIPSSSQVVAGNSGDGGGSAMYISSPIESIPPRRPFAPSEQSTLPFGNHSSLSSASTTPTGRSRRMPAHLPIPRSFKQQIQTQGQTIQGNNTFNNRHHHLNYLTENNGHNDYDSPNGSGGYYRDEDDNDHDYDGVEWLMMTLPPSEQQRWDPNHFDTDASIHDVNNGWGNQFVEHTAPQHHYQYQYQYQSN